MKFANIVPTAFLPVLGTQTNYHLALTHLVWSQGAPYIDFMLRRSKQGDFIIMDNSLIELGNAVDILQVVEAASVCGAHEVVLADVFLDKDKTLAAIQDSVDTLRNAYQTYKRIPFQLMAVPQGKNFSEWLECLSTILTRFPMITTIGIPKVTNTFFEDTDMGRIGVLQYLTDKGVPEAFPQIQWHMLGVWNNPIELKFASKYKWIRGCDTSIAWACSQKGILFDLEGGLLINRPKEAVIKFDSTVDRFPLVTIHNTTAMIGWSKFYE
jgi:hypothetical protein